MIDFQRHPVKLEHLSVHTEIHGDEEKPVLDLKLSADMPNVTLDQLAASLCDSLYYGDGTGDLLGKDATYRPHLRFPALGILRWGGDWHHVSLALHLGAKPKDDMRLVNGRLGKITLKPQEGGTYGYGFRFQIEPNGEVNTLMGLLKHSVPATLDTSEAFEDGEDTGGLDE
jgi:hypothetical protein